MNLQVLLRMTKKTGEVLLNKYRELCSNRQHYTQLSKYIMQSIYYFDCYITYEGSQCEGNFSMLGFLQKKINSLQL